MNAAQQLNDAIRRHLQDYLGIPAGDRTPHRYEQLVTSLAVSAENHTRAFIAERQEARRQTMKRTGGAV